MIAVEITVVAEVYDDHGRVAPVPVRGGSLAAIRTDGPLAAQVSTLDDGRRWVQDSQLLGRRIGRLEVE